MDLVTGIALVGSIFIGAISLGATGFGSAILAQVNSNVRLVKIACVLGLTNNNFTQNSQLIGHFLLV